MYEKSGSQFFRTTTGIRSVSDAFDESRFVMTFLTILGVTEICSFILLLERKEHKEIPEPSRLEFLENISANNFGVSDVEDNTFGPLNRGGIADLPLLITENTISKSPVVPRAKFMESNRFFCFLSVCKFGSFKNPSVTITSLSKL